MRTVKELRDEAYRLMEEARGLPVSETRKETAARAYQLAQHAELLERSKEDPAVLRANIARYRSMLADQTIDANTREFTEQILADSEELLHDSAEEADRLAWRNNVERITDEICRDTDLKSQQIAKNLLIIEENRFGVRAWQLETVEQHIANTVKRIDEQNARIIQMDTAGYDVTKLRFHLLNLIWVRDSFVQFHKSLLQRRDVSAADRLQNS